MALLKLFTFHVINIDQINKKITLYYLFMMARLKTDIMLYFVIVAHFSAKTLLAFYYLRNKNLW